MRALSPLAALLSAHAAWAAPAYVDGAHATLTTPASLSFAARCDAGELASVTLFWCPGDVPVTITDDQGDSFVVGATMPRDVSALGSGCSGPGKVETRVASCSGAGAGPTTLSFDAPAPLKLQVLQARWSGVNLSCPVDAVALADGPMLPAAAVLTTSSDDQRIVMAALSDQSCTGPATGFVQRLWENGDLLADRPADTAGPYDVGATCAARRWAVQAFSLRSTAEACASAPVGRSVNGALHVGCTCGAGGAPLLIAAALGLALRAASRRRRR